MPDDPTVCEFCWTNPCRCERPLTADDFGSGAPVGCRSSHPAGCFVAYYSPGPVGIGTPASTALCDACAADVHRVIGGG